MRIYDELLEVVSKGKDARIVYVWHTFITNSITDLQSFKEWWIHTDEDSQASFHAALSAGKVCITFPLHSQIQFNAGFWSLVDLSLVDYHELLAVITAGRLWVVEVFHIVVNTGIILGGYDYPAVILNAIRQSGVEFLIVYHAESNTFYAADQPMHPFYAHGGLDSDGKHVNKNPSVFLYGDAATDGELSDMVVQLAYGEDSRIVNNLVSIGCTSGAD